MTPRCGRNGGLASARVDVGAKIVSLGRGKGAQKTLGFFRTHTVTRVTTRGVLASIKLPHPAQPARGLTVYWALRAQEDHSEQ